MRSRGVTRRARTCAASALIIALRLVGVQPAAAAQIQYGSLHGTVVDPAGEPVHGAVVTLLDPLGEQLTSTVTERGSFRLANLAPGTYSLRAEAPSLRAVVPKVTVSAALPVHVEVRLAATASEDVVVPAPHGPDTTTTRVTLAGDAVRRAPARLRSRGLQEAGATAPGWGTEDNGILHVRGTDDGFLYVVDGVPVYERIDGLFGMAPDPGMVESVNIITGYVPPEFGLKAAAVVEVRSVARAAPAWSGAVDVATGSDRMGDVAAVAGGPLGSTTALTLGAAAQTSNRFLDPVHPDNLHNRGGSVNAGAQFTWAAADSSSVTAVAGISRARFEVPHGELQEEAGQDQRQRTGQQWQTVAWQHAASGSTVLHAAAYHRAASSALIGSPRDVPLFSDADRLGRRIGLLGSVTRQAGRHLLKIGAEGAGLRLRERFSFAVTDLEAAEEADLSDAATAHTSDRPFIFADAASPRLLSAYVQDSIRVSDRLTLDAGFRADWIRMLGAASQWSPRVGAAYRLAPDTTVRGSFGRFFQPPQAENLLLASAESARKLSPFETPEGVGGTDLEPEQQTAFEAGFEHVFARTARLDVAYWRRHFRNAADPNVFFGTTIIFPNAVARGRASGVDLRLELPRRRGWSAYASYSNGRIVQFGPITGGLFLEEEVIEIGPGTAFTPDHDQRHVGAAGLMFDAEPKGLSISLTGRYESGTPLEVDVDDFDELAERPGADLVDFSRGRVRPRRVLDLRISKQIVRRQRMDVDLRVTLLNLTGNRWAFNFGNPFSGTHFGPGRTIHAGARIGLR